MIQFLVLLAKAAAVYQGAKAAKTVIDYATTDQEKEGRELGIAIAAEVYAPVLEDLERQQQEINDATDREHANVQTQINLLREQLTHYERDTDAYKSKIETIKREHGNDPVVKAFLVTLAESGSVSIGAGAMLGANAARAFSSTVAAAGLSWLALPAAVVTYILESEMNDKREKFFKEEFDNKSLEWQEKIESCKAKIVTAIKNLRALKADGADKLNRLAKKVSDALQEYCGAQADYNTLKAVVKQK